MCVTYRRWHILSSFDGMKMCTQENKSREENEGKKQVLMTTVNAVNEETRGEREKNLNLNEN